MYNPFAEKKDEQEKDQDYIAKALGGNMEALEALVLRHQAWIYNIAVNMTNDMHISEDITQEVLIKVITKLSIYNAEKASFRTWLYRIVANHIINMKEGEKERTMTELALIRDFDEFVSRIPDTRKAYSPDHTLIREETKITCLQCILLCLNRRDRIVFVLGAVFGVGDSIGSEICGISRVNFRKILSRSRIKVNNFFKKNCSLINEDNPCKCKERTVPLMKLNMIDADDLFIDKGSGVKISDVLAKEVKDLEDSYYEFMALFRDQPFYNGPDMTGWLRDLMKRKDMRNLFSAS